MLLPYYMQLTVHQGTLLCQNQPFIFVFPFISQPKHWRYVPFTQRLTSIVELMIKS